MSWTDQIQVVTWGGIEIDVISVDDDLSRRVVEYSYPYKDGAELEDLGREPRRTNVVAVFFGSDYLERLVELITLIDQGKTQAFQHPVLGRWQAKCSRSTVKHSHERRDYADLDLELIEDGVNTSIPQIESVGAVQDEMETRIDDLQDATDNLIEDTDATQAFIDDAGTYVTDVEDQEGDRSDRLEQLKRFQKDAIAELDAIADNIKTNAALQAIRSVMGSATRLKERIERLAPRLTEKELSIHTPLVSIAATLYGDPDRTDELLRINQIRNPLLVPPGTKLKVFTS